MWGGVPSNFGNFLDISAYLRKGALISLSLSLKSPLVQHHKSSNFFKVKWSNLPFFVVIRPDMVIFYLQDAPDGVHDEVVDGGRAAVWQRGLLCVS